MTPIWLSLHEFISGEQLPRREWLCQRTKYLSETMYHQSHTSQYVDQYGFFTYNMAAPQLREVHSIWINSIRIRLDVEPLVAG